MRLSRLDMTLAPSANVPRRQTTQIAAIDGEPNRPRRFEGKAQPVSLARCALPTGNPFENKDWSECMNRLSLAVCAWCVGGAVACAATDSATSGNEPESRDEATSSADAPAVGDCGTDAAQAVSSAPFEVDAAQGGDAGVDQDPVVAAHIDVIRRRIAASNAQDWDTWQSLHAPDAVRTAPGLPGPVEGASAMRDAIEELFVTFPDYHLELREAFGSDDRLVARIHTRATMTGPLWLGETEVPATGQSFEQDWLAWLHFEGDKIVAIDEFYDNYEILVQLGLSQ